MFVVGSARRVSQTIGFRPSGGERQLWLAFILIASVGAVLGTETLDRLNSISGPRAWDTGAVWIALCGALGSAVALYLFRGWMGRYGIEGALRATAGGLAITLMAGVIAGTLILPLFGTMFGGWLLIATLLGNPLLAVLWIVTIAKVHLLIRKWSRERDSIFTSSDAMLG